MFPVRASSIAARVSALGVINSKGIIFSLATLVSKIRAASDNVSPIFARTAVILNYLIPMETKKDRVFAWCLDLEKGGDIVYW